MPPVSRKEVSVAVSHLMPNIIRGVSLDFFVRRGVTQTQFLVLLAVHSYQRCSMGTLARNLRVRMPTATGIIDRLVRDRFVHRAPCSEDRRQVFVELTPKGKDFIRQFQGVIRDRWEDVLKSLSPKELEAFFGVITKLRQQLQPNA
ncbi:MAG: MarR family transcriptional regulator [Candidatus Omnitrophica bacterium]|nr:MarR family transcriptional regulator [Candidatus Omnitrophota bacterium]